VSVSVIAAGTSRSFPNVPTDISGDGTFVIGANAAHAYRGRDASADGAFVAIELGTECLAEHVGLQADPVHARTVGFARFRLGEADPTALAELVSMPWTHSEAVAAAHTALESLGLKVARCQDFPGRIVDRLIRPYFNAVLRRFDEQLATADDLDGTLMMGLGYPEGPLALLERTGLDHHHDVTAALHEQLGGQDYLPARRARIAKLRALRTEG
jgi:3-hydroxybutyryl-CoA dehydrogenase